MNGTPMFPQVAARRPGGAQHVAHERGRRALAVAPGDGDDRPLQVAGGQLDLGDHLGAGGARPGEDRQRQRHARRDDHQLRRVEELPGVPVQHDPRARPLEALLLRGQLRGPAPVVRRDDGAAGREELRRGDPRAREAHDQHPAPLELRRRPRHAGLPMRRGGAPGPAGPGGAERKPRGRAGRGAGDGCRRALTGDAHLSFSVARLRSEKIRARIQNRITTFVSFQPDSSKWW